MASQRIVIAGCGFLGEAAAGFFCREGHRVLGICSSRESASRLEHSPFGIIAGDITSGDFRAPAGWDEPDVLVHCASSRGGGPDAYRNIYLRGLANMLRAFRPARVLFTGSTSVYAMTDGSWASETSPAEPDRETGRVLLEAEALALPAGGVVARLAGLYGPGRSVLLRKFLDGSAVLENGGCRWINQVHRDDAARALVTLASAPQGVYNVADNHPATQLQIFSWIAAALGRPLPPEGPADTARKRGWTNKRVSNTRLRSLGWSPSFPSYADALPSLLVEKIPL